VQIALVALTPMATDTQMLTYRGSLTQQDWQMLSQTMQPNGLTQMAMDTEITQTEQILMHVSMMAVLEYAQPLTESVVLTVTKTVIQTPTSVGQHTRLELQMHSQSRNLNGMIRTLMDTEITQLETILTHV
tara:strand:+ start:91 stop:483 length:393 start_codon:yes stop_codon:yes gene_type:complete